MMLRMSNPAKGRRREGFTLIELLVVIVIIGILVTLSIPRINAIRNQHRATQTAANLSKIQKSLEQFGVDNNGLYPFRMRWYSDATYEQAGFDPYTTDPDLHSEASAGLPWFSLGLFGGVRVVNDDFSENTSPDVLALRRGDNEHKVIQPNGWEGIGDFYYHFNQFSDPLRAMGYLGEYPENPFLRRPMGNIMWFYGDANMGSGTTAINPAVPGEWVVTTPGDFCYTFFYRTDGTNIMGPQGIVNVKKSYKAESQSTTHEGIYYLDLIDSYHLWAFGLMPLNGATYINYPNNGLGLSTKGRQVAKKDWDNNGTKDMFEMGMVAYYKRMGGGSAQARDGSGGQLEF